LRADLWGDDDTQMDEDEKMDDITEEEYIQEYIQENILNEFTSQPTQ
jgi:hypothetical protein